METGMKSRSEIRGMQRAVMASVALAGISASAAPIVLEFQYEAFKHRSQGFPEHCVSYMVFENPKKTRPLYCWGKQRRGTLALQFDDEEALGLEPEVKGSAEVSFVHSATALGDRQTFACSAWVNAARKPRIYVNLENVRKVTAAPGVMKNFFSAIRERDVMVAFMKTQKKDRQKPVPPVGGTKLNAVGDIEIKAGSSSARVEGASVVLELSGAEVWQVNYVTTVRIKGSDIGLDGDDAGELTVHVNGGAFCTVPPKFRAEVSEKELKKLGDIMNLDQKLEELQWDEAE